MHDARQRLFQGVPTIAERGARGSSLIVAGAEIRARERSTMNAINRLNGRCEGHECLCLDEVAWRHGMEGRGLVTVLDEEVTRAAPQDRDAGLTPNT